MFLCLGGSRRSTSSGIATTHGHGSPLLDCDQAPGVERGLVTQRSAPSPLNSDPLQTLATGKYATPFTRFGASPLPPYPNKLMSRTPTFSDSDPMLMYPKASPYSFTTSGSSPRSILPPFLPSPNLPSLSRETRLSSNNESVSEVLSRDRSRFEHQPSLQSRRSQTLILAKKLKESLGNKFADSLRETIKEVVKRERVEDEVKNHGGNPWMILQSLQDGLSRSESGISGKESWDGCWGVESKNAAHSVDASAILSTASESHPNVCSSLLACHGSFSMISCQSLKVSWLPHQNDLPQSAQVPHKAMADLSCRKGPPPRYSWDGATRVHENITQFFPSEHSSLLDSNIDDINLLLKESGPEGDCESPHILHRAIPRKHVFPEAAAMGTGTFNFRPSVDSPFAKEGEESLLDVLNFAGMKRSCSSISQLQKDSRQRLRGKSLTTKESSESTSWQGTGSSCCDTGILLQLPGFDLCNQEGVKKLPHDDDIDSASVQFSKRQCVELGSSLFEEDGGSGRKPGECMFGFEQYLAALAATERVPSYELSGFPISKFFEEFCHENLLPHVSS